MSTAATVGSVRNEIWLYPWELESMLDYSASLPSGVTNFKQWRRARVAFPPKPLSNPLRADEWIVGQYFAPPGATHVTTRWFRVVFRQGPRPPYWVRPDWERSHRWRAEGSRQI